MANALQKTNELTTASLDEYTHSSGVVVHTRNVVATIDLGCELDLKEIALRARNAEYNPKKFSAVIMRIRDPKATALLFRTGKMVCVGAKNQDACHLATRKFARIVQKLGHPAQFKNYKLSNVVGTCDVRFPIRLEGIHHDHIKFCRYEPELFPGLIYRLEEPRVSFLIFVTGKVVITGAKSSTNLHQAFDKIFPVLLMYRKSLEELEE